MDTLRYLLEAIRREPRDGLAWLALADGLEEAGEPERAELTRLTRRLLAMPRGDPGRGEPQGRLQGLLAAGVRPCLPEAATSVGMRLVLIPPGAFELGSPEGEADRYADEGLHEAAFEDAFWMGQTAVTQAQYRAVLPDAPPCPFVGDHLPVIAIGHGAAVAFCETLTALPAERAAGRAYRLPTEAEWEYACRAGTASMYHSGDVLTGEQAAFGRGHDQGPAAVGGFWPNAFGLSDMHGGVWEWCADWFDEAYYRVAPRVAPPGPESGRVRVIRGGSWSSDAGFCRAACREYSGPESRRPRDGFRVVMVPR